MNEIECLTQWSCWWPRVALERGPAQHLQLRTCSLWESVCRALQFCSESIRREDRLVYRWLKKESERLDPADPSTRFMLDELRQHYRCTAGGDLQRKISAVLMRLLEKTTFSLLVIHEERGTITVPLNRGQNTALHRLTGVARPVLVTQQVFAQYTGRLFDEVWHQRVVCFTVTQCQASDWLNVCRGYFHRFTSIMDVLRADREAARRGGLHAARSALAGRLVELLPSERLGRYGRGKHCVNRRWVI